MSRLPSVYLETTVISYLTGRPSRNLRVVAHQEITVDWWTRRRTRFELYVSRLVIDEAAAGDADAAARRLATLNGMSRRHGLSVDLELSAHRERHDAKPHCGCLRDIWVRSAGDLHARRVAGGLIMVAPNDRVNDDLQDEIIEEIRAVRRAHAAAFGFDVARIVADLRMKDSASSDRVVSLPPKPARHRRTAVGE